MASIHVNAPPSANHPPDLGELPPITENSSQTEPQDQHEADNHDFAPDTISRHPPFRPLGSPTASERGSIASQDPQGVNVAHIRETTNADHKRRSNPPRAGTFRQNAPGHAPRRHSTIDTNYSESFEKSKPWDRKQILSLGKGYMIINLGRR